MRDRANQGAYGGDGLSIVRRRDQIQYAYRDEHVYDRTNCGSDIWSVSPLIPANFAEKDLRNTDPCTNALRNAIGNSKSTTNMSWENLLMTLPAGVDMIHDGAVRNNPFSSAECRPLPDFLYICVSKLYRETEIRLTYTVRTVVNCHNAMTLQNGDISLV